jgi:universal stress protein A
MPPAPALLASTFFNPICPMKPTDSPKPKKPAAPSAIMGRVKVSYPRVRRILVPLDFSGKSRQALRYATPLAQKFASEIILLHVLPPTTKVASSGTPAADPTRAALRRLEAMAETLIPAELRGANVVREGSPYGEILATARKLDVDMIVLTTHGSSGLKRFFVGSTAEQVMRHATCPVLSVRRQ